MRSPISLLPSSLIILLNSVLNAARPFTLGAVAMVPEGGIHRCVLILPGKAEWGSDGHGRGALFMNVDVRGG